MSTAVVQLATVLDPELHEVAVLIADVIRKGASYETDARPRPGVDETLVLQRHGNRSSVQVVLQYSDPENQESASLKIVQQGKPIDLQPLFDLLGYKPSGLIKSESQIPPPEVGV